MTDREKAVVMAYTGACMLTGDKFQIFHKYVEDIMGRSVWTHEMALDSIADEIRAKSKDDFIALCVDESSSGNPNTCGDAISRQAVLEGIRNLYSDIPIVDIMGARRKWLEKYAPYFECENVVEQLPSVTPQPKTGQWIDSHIPESTLCECSECGFTCGAYSFNYCPDCGAKMEVK